MSPVLTEIDIIIFRTHVHMHMQECEGEAGVLCIDVGRVTGSDQLIYLSFKRMVAHLLKCFRWEEIFTAFENLEKLMLTHRGWFYCKTSFYFFTELKCWKFEITWIQKEKDFKQLDLSEKEALKPWGILWTSALRSWIGTSLNLLSDVNFEHTIHLGITVLWKL